MKNMDSKSNPKLYLLTDHTTETPPPPPASSDGRQPPPRRPSSRTPSFSSSASSLSGSPSSFSTSSSHSPFHRILPYSSIPFSWERQPGIPKSPSTTATPATGDRNPLLPLPPPVRSVSGISQKKRSASDVDPFTAALVECAKDAPGVDAMWWRRSDESVGTVGKMLGICRRTIMPDRVGFLDLFASFNCKTSCSVSDATIVVPRSRVRAASSYGVLDRRSE
ncbi:uncharacterized protein LOC110107487 [Dendrobium catenatum]|uniref:Uncharacterized protein n=1 Tax=Dendrobium catenatum TaxID=906689 RepID=A0A2I0W4F2_9ASPA|nr:uncharacterized protein LOC110107487 [Dendrobium catenatum]XP_020693421.1 uncharacterized protein LOC110107487 [Dendrobium catenatum]PKU70540.1 hypothetical protein MA16_Dca008657 [Dendrobium catenatum]